MSDDRFRRYDIDDDPDGWFGPDDDRLHQLVYVDGRLVESWTGPVAGTPWERHARRFDAEARARTPQPPPTPAHERALAWLDGLVGGRAALLALDDAPAAPPVPPTFSDSATAAGFAAVAEHLDRVAAALLDDDVAAVLAWAQHAAWRRRPSMFLPSQSANATAGGLVWVVGRANGLFSGDLRQQAVQRELWLRQQLSSVGQRVAPALRGISLSTGHRPTGAPDLAGFAEPALLTPATRRELMAWRDRALEAAAAG